jgi:hypothetical protein
MIWGNKKNLKDVNQLVTLFLPLTGAKSNHILKALMALKALEE